MGTHLEELEATWHESIPITVPMGIRLLDYDGDRLRVTAPLGANVNVHGTAFAGSLFALAALAGWGRTWLWLRERTLEGAIVIARADVRYARPIGGDLVAACTASPELLDRATSKLRARGRCRLALTVELRAADGRGETPAAVVEGDYAVTGQR